MSNDWFQDIVDFHNEVMLDKHLPKFPSIPHPAYQRLRRTLIKEEVKETIHAITMNDVSAIADGIADSIVVLLGTAVTYGIDMRPIWDIVHGSNMAKKGGKLRADGKMLKKEGWQPPDIAGEIRRQQANINTIISKSDEGGSK